MDFESAPAIAFRNATVVTVDDAGVVENGDVLVVGDRIAAVGVGLDVPEGAAEVDARHGILMPGMIDTHRRHRAGSCSRAGTCSARRGSGRTPPTSGRATLNADRARCHLDGHRDGRTTTLNEARAEDVVRWATIGGAKAIGREHDLGSIRVGKKADLVLVKNDRSPAMRPVLHPYGHIRGAMGEQAWHEAMSPALPDSERIAKPYTYAAVDGRDAK